jgi:phytoene synthase
VLEDAEMNRRYIPGDWVGGACPATIAEAAARPEGPVAQQVTIAVKRLLALAETFYASGRRGYGYLPIRAHLAIAVAARVYRQIGVQLADADHAWHAGRQVTSSATKAGCSLRAMLTLTDRFAPRRGLHDPSLHSSLKGLPYVV